MSLSGFIDKTATPQVASKQNSQRNSARRTALALKLYESLMQQAAIQARLFTEFHRILYPEAESD